MSDRNRSKKVWQHINTMINKPLQKRQHTKLYRNSTEVNEEDIPAELETKWKSIYQKHTNEIPTKWSTQESERYARSHDSKKTDSQQFTIGPESRQATVPIALREHFDTAFAISEETVPMEDNTITEEEVKSHIKKLKL